MFTPGAGDVVADRYAIRKIVGRGGMGLVYEAHNLVTGKRVALKWLLPSAGRDTAHIHRLIREARASARVKHPNVVDVYDVSEHEGCPFLVMEYLEGIPLSVVLDETTIDPGRLLATLIPVLEGLAAVHRQGVVHRDLKPSNVFLCTDDRGRPTHAKLLDFGVSKIQGLARPPRPTGEEDLVEPGVAGEASITEAGSVVGTPQYMAPEQLDEARSVDQRADVYAVGVILYRALAGALPFDADTYSTLVLRITSGVAPSLDALRPGLPPGLAAVVERAMARHPDDRFSDVNELQTALAPYASTAGLGSDDDDWRSALRAGSPVHAPAKRPLQRPAMLVGALLALGVLAGVLASRQFSEASPLPPTTIAPTVADDSAALQAPAAPATASQLAPPVAEPDRPTARSAPSEPPPGQRPQVAAKAVTPAAAPARARKLAPTRTPPPPRKASAAAPEQAAPARDPLSITADQF